VKLERGNEYGLNVGALETVGVDVVVALSTLLLVVSALDVGVMALLLEETSLEVVD